MSPHVVANTNAATATTTAPALEAASLPSNILPSTELDDARRAQAQTTAPAASINLDERAQEIHRAIEDGLLGWGTDEERLFKALAGLSPEQMQALRGIYERHYGCNLDEHVRGDLSGAERARAESLLQGDKLAAEADALRAVMEGMGTDEAAIRQILSSHTPAELYEIAERYQARYGETLRETLVDDLSGDELNEALRLLEGDRVGATAARVHHAIAGLGTDEAAVREALTGLSESQLSELRARYQQSYGESLQDDLKGDYSGHELAEVMALEVGAVTDAAAIRLNAAVVAEDRSGVQREFQGKTAAEREALLAAYERAHGRPLSGDLQHHFSGHDLDKVATLINHGELTLAQQFHDAIDGLGTGNEIESLLRRLGDLSTAEAQAVHAAYAERYGESLPDALAGDLSGDIAADARLYLNGLPDDPSARAIALAERTLAMVSRDRDGFSLGNILLDGFTEKDERLDESAAKLRELLTELKQRPGVLAPADLARLSELQGWVGSHLGDVRSAKDSVAETAATVGATAAAAAAVVATAGAATVVIVGAAAAAGGAGYVAGKAAVTGADYEIDGIGVDFASGAVDGMMNLVGAGVATRAAGVLRAGVVGRVAAGAVEASVDAGLGGAAGGMVQTALDRETWREGIGAGLEKIGTAATIQGLVGAVTGIGIRGGTAALGYIADGIGAVAARSEPATRLPGQMPLSDLQEKVNHLSELFPDARPVVLGRAGQIRVGGDDGMIARHHLEIGVDANGNYRLFDGERASMNGVEVNGRLIPKYTPIEVSPADTIRLGIRGPFVRLPTPEYGLSPADAAVVAKLYSGQRITIGRDPRCDIVVDSPCVSCHHLIAERQANGRIAIFDGRPSATGTEVKLNGKWRPVRGEMVVPPGTPVRLNQSYEFSLPRPDRPFYGRDLGQQWRCVGNPLSSQFGSSAEVGAVARTFTAPDGTGITIDGLISSGLAAKQLDALLAQLDPKFRAEIRSIKVVREIGEFMQPDGVEVPIRAFPVDQNGRLVVTLDALRNKAQARELLEQLGELRRLNKMADDQDRGYTILAQDHLRGGAHFDRAGQHGQFGERPLLGRDTPYNQSVNPRFQAITSVPFLGIVIDDVKYPKLGRIYSEVYQSKLQRVASKYAGVEREQELMKTVFEHVYGEMRYERECDNIVMRELGIAGINYGPGNMPKVDILEYISRKIGVCEHQAMYAGYLVEKLQREGVLGPNVRISHERNHIRAGGHSWARVTLSDGTVWVIDPAQKYVGPMQGAHNWVYARPEDAQRLQRQPV